MNGKTSLKDCKVQVEDFNTKVEEYSKLLGLTSPAADAILVEDWLTWTPEQYVEVGPDELSRMSLVVMAFSYKIQTEVARHQVKLIRCKFVIAKLVELKLMEYEVFHTEDKRLAAIMDTPKALHYYEIERNYEAFIARWGWVPGKLDVFAKGLKDMTYNKR